MNHRWPGAERYPQLEKDRPISLEPLEIGWPFQRLSLREYGIPIAGPLPKEFVDPVNPDDLRRSVAVVTREWQQALREDPTWLPWAREAFPFIVLTLCRCLYSLAKGGVASKPRAGRWMQERLAPRWSETQAVQVMRNSTVCWRC